MRLILTTIILTMLTQPVSAVSNKKLYEMCKPYADRGFELSESSDVVGIYQDGLCQGYMIATIEQLSDICEVYEWAKEEQADKPDLVLGTKIAAMAHGTSANLDNLDAVTQLFVNYAAANPTKWEYKPDASDWLSEAFPCKE